MRRYTFVVAAVLAVLVPSREAALADAPRYSIQNLGTLGGLVPTITGINASGQVSGYVNAPEGQRATRYTDGRGWEYLPGLDNTFSVATGISAAGDLVGYYQNAEGAFRAFRLHDGAIEAIGPIGGGSSTLGLAISPTGLIVGYADTLENGVVGFLARPGEAPVVLPSLGGGLTLACGVNDAGQVAGWGLTGDGAQHAIRIDSGQPSPIDIGNFTSESMSTACAIDADGRVGGVVRKNDIAQAFRFTDGAFENLAMFGSLDSNVESIAQGVSVGWYLEKTTNQTRAFVHTDEAGSVDLNTLADNATGWNLSMAKAVNADGVIAGEGNFQGNPAVFRLVPQARDTTPPDFDVTLSTTSMWPPKGQLVIVTANVTATDDSGKTPACSLTGIAGPGSSPADYNLTGPQTAYVRAVGGATYTLTETCVDAAGNGAAKAYDVVVPRDTTAPAVTSISATPKHIWPPNNKMVPVSVYVFATDDVDDAPSCSVTSVSGAPSSDYEITGRFTANVRATKNDDGSTRAYSLMVTCADAAGNRSTAVAKVFICKEQSETVTAMATLVDASDSSGSSKK
jgi:probable HAF family extracellular repeat protein